MRWSLGLSTLVAGSLLGSVAYGDDVVDEGSPPASETAPEEAPAPPPADAPPAGEPEAEPAPVQAAEAPEAMPEVAPAAPKKKTPPPVSKLFTDDFKLRYWQIPETVPGFPNEKGVLSYVEQVNRFTANVRVGKFSFFGQLDQVALFGNSYFLDGERVMERELMAPGIFNILIPGQFDHQRSRRRGRSCRCDGRSGSRSRDGDRGARYCAGGEQG